MTNDDREQVKDTVENEGFDYAFRFYTMFDEIDDAEFHKRRRAYIEAAEALSDYVGIDY